MLLCPSCKTLCCTLEEYDYNYRVEVEKPIHPFNHIHMINTTNLTGFEKSHLPCTIINI